MKSDEIRRDLKGKLQGKSLDQAQILVLIEIAAQLAKANELAEFELGFDQDAPEPERPVRPSKPVGENTLMVGLTKDETEVVINHPNLLTDKDGAGYIVFSPSQARDLANLLLKKADECV